LFAESAPNVADRDASNVPTDIGDALAYSRC